MSSTILFDNLLQILFSIILLFNVGAFKLMWNRIQDESQKLEKERKERKKNSETINMIINRIFGLEEDPTDTGHLEETQNRFEKLDGKLDDIVEMQKEAKEERKEEHEEVKSSINYIVSRLSTEEGIDFDEEKI